MRNQLQGDMRGYTNASIHILYMQLYLMNRRYASAYLDIHAVYLYFGESEEMQHQ